MGCAQAGGPAACVGWYQLGNLDGAPSLLRQGIVDDATNPGRHRYFPSLAADQNGNVVLGYGYSSATEYPGVAYTTISPSGELGGSKFQKGHYLIGVIWNVSQHRLKTIFFYFISNLTHTNDGACKEYKCGNQRLKVQ